MRAMTPEERRILLRLMNEAEAEAARGSPEGVVRPHVQEATSAPTCTSPGRLAHHPP
jgi:hypothetical protein